MIEIMPRSVNLYSYVRTAQRSQEVRPSVYLAARGARRNRGRVFVRVFLLLPIHRKEVTGVCVLPCCMATIYRGSYFVLKYMLCVKVHIIIKF